MQTLTRAAALALVCVLSTASNARELFILDAGTVRDGDHDVERLVSDYLLRRGQFAGLALTPTSTATLDYLGIPNAVVLSSSAFGNQVTLQIPSTGFSRTFVGTSPASVRAQIEDFIENGGSGELAKFYEKTSARTPLALLDGNPRATTALFARGAYERFGAHALHSRGTIGEDDDDDDGHFDLYANAGAGQVDANPFDDLWVADASLTFGGHADPGIGVYLTGMGQYRNYDRADIYDAGLELALPIAILRPGGGNPVRWMITPVGQAGGGASRDTVSGGFLAGGGGVSSLGVNLGPVELTIANSIFYYHGIDLGEIEDISIDTDLDQWLTRNGGRLALYPFGGDGFWLEGGASVTNFLGHNAALDWWVTPFAGIGVKLGDVVRMRLGWESDFGDHDYAVHTARADFGFEF
jgi:hypothetical protein